MSADIQVSGECVSFVGPDAIALYRALIIEKAIRLYVKTGLKPSRMYTPTAMLKAASSITSKQYRRGDLLKAADDIRTWSDTMRAGMQVEGKC